MRPLTINKEGQARARRDETPDYFVHVFLLGRLFWHVRRCRCWRPDHCGARRGFKWLCPRSGAAHACRPVVQSTGRKSIRELMGSAHHANPAAKSNPASVAERGIGLLGEPSDAGLMPLRCDRRGTGRHDSLGRPNHGVVPAPPVCAASCPYSRPHRRGQVVFLEFESPASLQY